MLNEYEKLLVSENISGYQKLSLLLGRNYSTEVRKLYKRLMQMMPFNQMKTIMLPQECCKIHDLNIDIDACQGY